MADISYTYDDGPLPSGGRGRRFKSSHSDQRFRLERYRSGMERAHIDPENQDET
jgi:hypothetical protein